MSSADGWTAVEEAREAYRRIEAEIPRLRTLHGDLEALHRAVVRNRADASLIETVDSSLLDLEAPDDDRTVALSFLTEDVLAEDRTVAEAFETGRAVSPAASAVATNLTAYANTGDWGALADAMYKVYDPDAGPMAIDTTALDEVVTLFGLAIEAGIEAREKRADRLQDAIADAYADHDGAIPDMEHQPLALLPVRLETRFVDDQGTTKGDPTSLLIRVYPDQIHTDSHEEQLTDGEIRWGKRFWATLWLGAHRDATENLTSDPSDHGYGDELNQDALGTYVNGIDLTGFSNDPQKRYRELKERGWRELLDRFGRERAAYVVHALEPTDDDLVTRLVHEPPGPHGNDDLEAKIGSDAFLEPDTPTFPEVPRRPESWTQRPRASLLPDRWIAIGEWTAPTGATRRIAVAGDPIREPLPIGPSPESVADTEPEADRPAPPGTEWMTDFTEAEDVGMGLRIRLEQLEGFGYNREFDRLTVVGVRSADDADGSVDELADLLDAHHYTDGLELLQQGTPTNNHDKSSGYTRSDDALASMETEVGPPLTTSGDRTDGDLLARALGINTEVFEHVANADGTEQRDARHVNRALWPATMGYYLAHIAANNELVGNPSLNAYVETGQTTSSHLLWRDAYRRHFVRYVRGRGPFPALRVGRQPYGITPARAIDTERDLTIVDQQLVADIRTGRQSVGSLTEADLASVAGSGVDHKPLIQSGVDPGTMVAAGAEPERLVETPDITPENVLDECDLTPESVRQDGVGLVESKELTDEKLAAAGSPTEDREATDVSVRDLARGEVTDEQLAAAGLDTETVAEAVLPRRARQLGITPSALSRAGVTPGALLRGEVTAEQLAKLDLSTRAVAEAALPPAVREVGLTPRAVEAAGIEPTDLINGTVSAEALTDAGVTTEAMADALLPEELREAGITPERVGNAVGLAEFVNGDVSMADLEEAGLTTETVVDVVLPDGVREAGIDGESLVEAGVTPDAILNGDVTPQDIVEAGVTPEALAEAGVLPDALASVGTAIEDLLSAGFDPTVLVERGLSVDALLDSGLNPATLVDAGLGPKRLVDAGLSVVDLATAQSLPVEELVAATPSASELARLGVAAEKVAAGDIPAQELVQAGFTAVDLLKSGADALGIAEGGARVSQLREAGVDAGTLRDAGKAAGSMRRAGYDPSELLDSGYTAEELLNGGYTATQLRDAGADPDAVSAGRSVAQLVAAGTPPAALRSQGYGPEQLRDAGLGAAGLVEAGYTAGELRDAGLTPAALVEAGMAVEQLRAADVDVETLVEAGADPAALMAAGASAAALHAAGVEESTIRAVGYSDAELRAAGLDPEPEKETATDPTADLPYAATVVEAADRAERDQYAFSFDPAVPRGATEPDDTGADRAADGGAATTGPVARALSVDDMLDGRLADRVSGFAQFWDEGVANLPVTQQRDGGALLDSLQREAISARVRQDATTYSGEPSREWNDINEYVRSEHLQDSLAVTQSALESADLLDLDPRLAFFYTTDITYRESKLSQLDSRELDTGGRGTARGVEWVDHEKDFLRFHTKQPTFPIERDAFADGDIDAFVEMLLGSDPNEIRALAGRVSSALDIDESAFDSVPSNLTLGQAAVTQIETGTAPEAFVGQLLNDDAADHEGARKLRQLAENAEQYGDSGVLRSLLRQLLQVGTLEAYLSARQRLGQRYDHPMEGRPQRAYLAHDMANPMTELYDDAPTGLCGHPGVSPNDRTYMDALVRARDPSPSTTSVDPALSEYFDSLRYLRTMDAAALETAVTETLDLCSHRIDAWWTSLGTKRLFELRERQTLDLSAVNDIGAAPRATLDPGVVDGTDLSGVDHSTYDASKIAETEIQVDTETVSTPGTASTSQSSIGTDVSVPPTGGAGGDDPSAATDDGDDSEDEPSTDGGPEDVPEVEPGLTGDHSEGINVDDPVGTTDTPDISEGTVETPDSLVENGVATGREGSDVDPSVPLDPGVYVGAYGFVENLSPDVDGRDTPEYVHAPSQQQATTAAVLRSGYLAHGGREGWRDVLDDQHRSKADETVDRNALSLELAPEQVRQGERLIRAVRHGQSLAERLGYRFERELREATLTEDVDLMQYLDVFREAFPATAATIERPDASEVGEDHVGDSVVDGRKLLDQWGDYPFERDGDLPDGDSDDYAALDNIVEGLQRHIEAANDLLTAESVHQLTQGNFERAGGSVAALARGETLPEPQVAEVPRSETRLSHRQALLFGTPEAGSTTPRSNAEPALAAWVGELLPAHDSVECLATYRWTEAETDIDGSEREVERTQETSIRLSALALGPLDVMLLFGGGREGSRSELEQRFSYRLLRDRPEGVPTDAEVELDLSATATAGATAAADLLELARAIRELVGEARPATAEDFVHPSDGRGTGQDEGTAKTLSKRADEAQSRLLSLITEIDGAIALLASDHRPGDGTTPLPDALGASGDGGLGADLTAAATASTTLAEDAAAVGDAAAELDDSVPLERAASVAETIEASELRAELSRFAAALPAGPTDPEDVSAGTTVRAETEQPIEGTLGDQVEIPDPPAEGSFDPDDITVEEPPQMPSDPVTVDVETAPMRDQPETDIDGDSYYATEVQSVSTPELDSASTADMESVSTDDIDAVNGSDIDFEESEPRLEWEATPVTVHVWGTDGRSWFELTEQTQSEPGGSFSVTLDFSGVEPGTPFRVAAVADGTVVHSGAGRVVGGDRDESAGTVLESCPNLRKLLWLADRRSAFDEATFDRLTGAIAGLDGDAVAGLDDSGLPAELSTGLDALETADGLETEAVRDALAAALAPVDRLRLESVVDTFAMAGDGPAGASYSYVESPVVGDVRTRLERTLDNPGIYNETTETRLLTYAPEAASVIASIDDGHVVAAYLDAWLSAPPWALRYLDQQIPQPARLVCDLTAWLYGAKEPETAQLGERLRKLAGATDALPSLAVVFGDLQPLSLDGPVASFGVALERLADALPPAPEEDDAAEETATFDTTLGNKLTTFTKSSNGLATGLDPLTGGAAARAVRTVLAERLREAMTVAASYGVFGGTPESAAGGSADDVETLVTQGHGLLAQLRERLTAAAAVDPTLDGSADNRPVGQRVDDATERLETLFGDGFTVLPPFEPANGGELTATFTDSGLVPDGRKQAAESWLQRAARFRERVDDYRETRSYSELLTDTVTDRLTVGQVPYEPGDEWVGADGVDPQPGKLSLVTQFGPDVTPGTADKRLTGLFIDEWTESVPEETETTGVALNYDDPGARAPQSILLATPPEEGTWSLDDIAATVTETADYARRRTVDAADMGGQYHSLFPALFVPNTWYQHPPRTPRVRLEDIERYGSLDLDGEGS